MNPDHKIKPGASRSEIFTVEERHTALHIGSGKVGVLATPWMIAFMEINTRKMLDELLPEGYTTVGTHVDVSHRAPAALGSQVSAYGEVQTVDGKRITLAVKVTQGDTTIGEGRHQRYIIDSGRFLQRLEGKASP
ncbi:MAG: thioesterase family protein [Anaerolineae bacterium]|nr:thioesterase family protein [Anaerolineae bacterium]